VEYEGIPYEIETTEQMQALERLIDKAEARKAEQRRLEDEAERIQRRREREFEAEQAVQRQLERAAKRVLEVDRAIKDAHDQFTEDLLARLTIEPERVEIKRELKTYTRLGNSTGLRQLARSS
jgi:hypothetical protein